MSATSSSTAAPMAHTSVASLTSTQAEYVLTFQVTDPAACIMCPHYVAASFMTACSSSSPFTSHSSSATSSTSALSSTYLAPSRAFHAFSHSHCTQTYGKDAFASERHRFSFKMMCLTLLFKAYIWDELNRISPRFNQFPTLSALQEELWGLPKSFWE